MDIRPLLTLNFWLNGTPPPMQPLFENIFLALFIVALVIAIVFSKIERKETFGKAKRMLCQKLRRCATTFGIVGLVWMFFEYERAPYLAMKLWLLLLVVGVGVWKISAFLWYVRNVKVMAQKKTDAQELGKYLPR